ncbi:hypothetical protein Leryth_006739 [Lithospermum erythrorhizon]|nr:hypothetical protein Leryth_006739 [Lithospermum erythrorhizon]
MRAAGGCSVDQALAAEAACLVKQAVALARQRGHAQVTPLHVANTMLSSSTGLFRKACLQSHSHPLQCRALELCFNVALNRLPVSSSSSNTPMLGPYNNYSHCEQQPAISNALVAAFKRAQAHQRRGSIENQQQPILVIKIELEQLIISILDDPSVSRVMKEAGFSSTKVKSNVEQAIVINTPECPPPSSPSMKDNDNNSSKQTNFSSSREIEDDVDSVIEILIKRRGKSIVVVGECIQSIDSVIKGVLEKFEKSDHIIPDDMKEVKLISITLQSFAKLHREEVQEKIGGLTCLVRSLLDKGVILCLGDLKWISDYRISNCFNDGQLGRGYYCPVEHMIMEVGRLIYGFEERTNFWLLGMATFQTYMKCRTGDHQSLERVWGLHPLILPAGNLGLSLQLESDNQRDARNKRDEKGSCQLNIRGEKENNCCEVCLSKLEVEIRNLQVKRCNCESTLSSLPSWLRNVESKRPNNDDQSCTSVQQLRKKWSSICNSVHKKSKSLERSLTLPASTSDSLFSCNHHYQTSVGMSIYEPNADGIQGLELNNPNTSTSSSETMEMDYVQRFTTFSSKNLNIICHALEKTIPGNKESIPEIAGTVLQCRSRMVKRKANQTSGETKQETWFLFQGQDVESKEKIAKELARIVFGSYSNFEAISLSSFSSSIRANSIEEFGKSKRCRDDQSCSYIGRFARAVSFNPHRVFYMEDMDQVDYCSQKGINRAMERGKVTNSCGEEVVLGDAIIILSCESLNFRPSRGCSPSISLDLNLCFDSDGSRENQLVDDDGGGGFLENVDRCIVFKLEE